MKRWLVLALLPLLLLTACAASDHPRAACITSAYMGSGCTCVYYPGYGWGALCRQIGPTPQSG